MDHSNCGVIIHSEENKQYRNSLSKVLYRLKITLQSIQSAHAMAGTRVKSRCKIRKGITAAFNKEAKITSL